MNNRKKNDHFKKIFLLVLIGILFVSGCSKKEELNEKEQKQEVVLADDEYMFNNVLYKINQDEKGYGIKYKIASNFRKVDSGNALNYYSEKNDDNTSNFVIRIFRYKNKDIKYAIKDTTDNKYDNKSEVEINGVKYTKVHFTNFNDANTYLFYHKNKKDVYAFCFTAWVEEERLENIFLSQVVY